MLLVGARSCRSKETFKLLFLWLLRRPDFSCQFDGRVANVSSEFSTMRTLLGGAAVR